MDDIYASVDLGGTNIKCVFGDSEGQILLSDSKPTHSHEGPEAVLQRIASLVNDMREELGKAPVSLGMGIPGLVDLEEGVTRYLPNLETHWRDVAVRAFLEPRVGCPVYLLNDVRCATLGEMVYGYGSTAEDFVFYAIGTGIGGGVVLGGKLRLGPDGAAGELGHVNVIPDGPHCGCGSRGCLETVAGGSALTAAGVRLLKTGLASILYEIVEGDLNRVSPKTMAQAARQGDEKVREELERAGEFLGIAMGNVVSTVHPGLIVIGGGVSQMGELILDPIRETVKRRVRMLPVEDLQIVVSQLQEKAGALGGIALAINKGLL